MEQSDCVPYQVWLGVNLSCMSYKNTGAAGFAFHDTIALLSKAAHHINGRFQQRGVNVFDLHIFHNSPPLSSFCW